MQKLKIIFMLYLLLCSGLLFAKTPIYTEKQTQITVKANQPTFIIKLKSNPTTGYEWSVNYNNKLLKVRYAFESPYDSTQKRQMLGTPGYGVWTFELVPQPRGALAIVRTTDIQFSYQRKWEKQPVDNRVFTVMLPISEASPTNDAR